MTWVIPMKRDRWVIVFAGRNDGWKRAAAMRRRRRCSRNWAWQCTSSICWRMKNFTRSQPPRNEVLGEPQIESVRQFHLYSSLSGGAMIFMILARRAAFLASAHFFFAAGGGGVQARTCLSARSWARKRIRSIFWTEVFSVIAWAAAVAALWPRTMKTGSMRIEP